MVELLPSSGNKVELASAWVRFLPICEDLGGALMTSGGLLSWASTGAPKMQLMIYDY